MAKTANPAADQEVIALLPAGGLATRLAPLPGSKELFPVGFYPSGTAHALRPKPVCSYLLERMRLAGIKKAYVILREGKWDIPTYLGDGHTIGMDLAYLMLNLPYGTPFTLDQAYPFVQHALIALGFPDILFQPDDAFTQLLQRQAETKADIVLGLFPAQDPSKMDMIEFDDLGQISRIVIKPRQTTLTYTWILAVWTPIFTKFMHQFLIEKVNPGDGEPVHEIYVGHVIQAAIEQNMPVETVMFPEGSCLDIGTPEMLMQAVYQGVKDRFAEDGT
jgi:glucose-1-phosphate thymidylyltransferase